MSTTNAKKQTDIGSVVRQVHIPLDMQAKIKSLCGELGINEGEVLATAILFLHRVYEVRREGKTVIFYDPRRGSYQRVSPGIIVEKFGLGERLRYS